MNHERAPPWVNSDQDSGEAKPATTLASMSDNIRGPADNALRYTNHKRASELPSCTSLRTICGALNLIMR